MYFSNCYQAYIVAEGPLADLELSFQHVQKNQNSASALVYVFLVPSILTGHPNFNCVLLAFIHEAVNPKVTPVFSI